MTTIQVGMGPAFFIFRTFDHQEEKMYIEMKRKGVNVGGMIAKLQQKKSEGSVFPYRGFVCRCGNCRYSSQGKCALKECCCMDCVIEEIKRIDAELDRMEKMVSII